MSGTGTPRTAVQRPVELVSVPAGVAGLALLADVLPGALSGNGVVALVPQYAPAAVRTAIRRAVTPNSPLPVDAAVICPTSGSTGQPRGVVLTSQQMRAAAGTRDEAQGGGSAWLLGVPPVTAPALAALVRAGRVGAPVTTWRDAGMGAFDAAAFMADAEALLASASARGLPARASIVAAQLRRLLHTGSAADTLARFDAVLVGGGPTSPQLVAEAEGAGVRLVRTYGMTETFGGCVYDGHALPGVHVRIDAPDANGVGQVLLGGATLAAGYAQGPLRLIDGLLATGDRGRLVPVDPGLPGGSTMGGTRLELRGRGDEVVTVGGTNVDLAAVSAAVAEVPAADDSAVVALPAPDGGHRLVAFVVPDAASADEAAANPDRFVRTVRTAVGAALGRAARPSVRVVPALPRLPGGKVDLQRLAEEAR